jgi:hypothetical protein
MIRGAWALSGEQAAVSRAYLLRLALVPEPLDTLRISLALLGDSTTVGAIPSLDKFSKACLADAEAGRPYNKEDYAMLTTSTTAKVDASSHFFSAGVSRPPSPLAQSSRNRFYH